MESMLLQLAQIGGVGIIAAFLIWEARENRRQMAALNAAHQEQMAKRLGNLEETLIAIVRNNTDAMRGLRSALDRRPCLRGDEEVRDEEARASA